MLEKERKVGDKDIEKINNKKDIKNYREKEKYSKGDKE